MKNRYRSHVRKSNKDKQNIDENVFNSRVFVKLASYVKKEVNSGKPLIKLSELHSLYESRLEDLGNAKSVNKTRLKERLLEYFKEAQEQFDGRNTFLVSKEGMRNMIQDDLKKRDFSEDALILARAASIIRKDMSVSRHVTAIKSQDPHFLNSQWIQLEKPRETRVPSMPHYWPGHSL